LCSLTGFCVSFKGLQVFPESCPEQVISTFLKSFNVLAYDLKVFYSEGEVQVCDGVTTQELVVDSGTDFEVGFVEHI
jgi:NADPH-dependent 7-cyano-7-deazaguanine reductase QueF